MRGSKVNIEGVILKTIAVTGVLAVALVAPNALQLIKLFDKAKKRKKNPKYLVNAGYKRLLEKKLISLSRDGSIRLTKLGERQLHMIETGMFPQIKQKWDGKWRIVIFDVNEKRKKSREKLRFLLKHVGFVYLQDSVWVYPYDVVEVISLIQCGEYLEKEILYLVSDIPHGDAPLREHFKL